MYKSPKPSSPNSNRDILWRYEAIEQALGQDFHAPRTGGVYNVSIDTRTLSPGDLFVALKGEHQDGHRFLGQAVQKGAGGLIIEKGCGEIPQGIPYLVVEDAREALLTLARFARKRFKGSMIAITGSVGKTTTKNLTCQCLGAYGPTHCAIKSYNNQLGISLTLANLPENDRYCICEIGMNHKGEIAPLAELIRPDIGVITTIGHAHIGYMKTIEAIKVEKLSLLGKIISNGIAIVPTSLKGDASLKDVNKKHRLAIWYVGEQNDDQIRPLDIQPAAGGLSIRALIGSDEVAFTLPTEARHIAHDSLIALGICAALKLPLTSALKQLASFKPSAGRGKIYKLPHRDIRIIDESYNASPESMKASLAYLSGQAATRRIAILGDMAELGDYAKSQHEMLASSLPQEIDYIFVCGKHMKSFFDSLKDRENIIWKADAQELARAIAPFLRDGDLLLIKGSRSMHLEDILTDLTKEERPS